MSFIVCFNGSIIPTNPYARKIKDHIIDKKGRKRYDTEKQLCEICNCYIQERFFKNHLQTKKHVANNFRRERMK